MADTIDHDHTAGGLDFYSQDHKALKRHLIEHHGYIEEDDGWGWHLTPQEQRSEHGAEHYAALVERGSFAEQYEDDEDEPDATA